MIRTKPSVILIISILPITLNFLNAASTQSWKCGLPADAKKRRRKWTILSAANIKDVNNEMPSPHFLLCFEHGKTTVSTRDFSILKKWQKLFEESIWSFAKSRLIFPMSLWEYSPASLLNDLQNGKRHSQSYAVSRKQSYAVLWAPPIYRAVLVSHVGERR